MLSSLAYVTINCGLKKTQQIDTPIATRKQQSLTQADNK